MIIVKKRPYDRCMSGNPIMYELYSAVAATNAEIYFEVKVMFTPAYNVSFAELCTIPVVPVNGTAKFDIKDILDGSLEHNVPKFDVDERLASEARGHTGLFYIQFREILTAGSDPSWNDSESEYKKFVMKGGLSYFKYRGDNFWINYFNDNNPFLTWRESGRLARTKDRMYLAFLLDRVLPSFEGPEVVPAALWASCLCYYTDGTAADIIYKEVLDNYEWSFNFIPAGATQWGLPALDASKKIHKWEIQMWYTSDVDLNKTALNEPFVFYADNRHDYKNVVLQYRNSLGGLDPLLLRGVIEQSQNYSFDEQDRTVLADYFDGDLISPSRIIANAKEKVIYKGDAGLLAKEEQQRMRDMKLDRNAIWDISKKWWPVNIVTSSFNLTSSDKNEWPFPVEFSFAYDGDQYYTPDAVDLGDRTFKSNVCEAEITNITHDVDTGGPTATDEINFTYTPGLLKYTYQVPGVHADPIEANTADLPLVLTDLALEQVYSIKLRPLCTGDILGRVFESGFNTIGAGGGGGGGTGGSTITNNSIYGRTVIVKQDGVEIYSSYIPAGGTDAFDPDDLPNTTIELEFVMFTPSLSLLESDGNDYAGTITTDKITFSNVAINGGCVINYY